MQDENETRRPSADREREREREKGSSLRLSKHGGEARDRAAAEGASRNPPPAGTPKREGQSHRKLEPRHISLLAIGGTIGTALFVGIGSGLTSAGPLSLCLGYTFWASVIFAVNCCQAEMVVQTPIDCNFIRFAGRYVDDAFGLAEAVNFYLTQAALVAFEVVAFSIVLSFWTEVTPKDGAIVVGVLVAVYGVLNLWNAKFFGEFEFWAAMGKLLLITGLLLMTFFIMVGANPQRRAIGFSNWSSGAMNEYLHDGSLGRFEGLLAAVISASFTIAGPDYLSVAAGECRHPRRVMPRAFRSVIYRLVGFFGLGSLAVGILVPYDDPNLLGAIAADASGAARSPYVIGMQRVGITVLPDIVNAGILTSIFSAGLAYVFCGSRTLYAMALHRQAPRFLAVTNRNGVPYIAVLITLCFALLGLMQLNNDAYRVLNWFINLVTASQLITWIVMAATWIRWNRAMAAQGVSRDALRYRSRCQPYAAWYALACSAAVLAINGYTVFLPGQWKVDSFLFSYGMIAVFAVVFFGTKIIGKTRWRPLASIDLVGESPDIDEYEAELQAEAAAEAADRAGGSGLQPKLARAGQRATALLW